MILPVINDDGAAHVVTGGVNVVNTANTEYAEQSVFTCQLYKVDANKLFNVTEVSVDVVVFQVDAVEVLRAVERAVAEQQFRGKIGVLIAGIFA